jgi:ribosomal protein S18 acetylase RimI-like enzyme
MQLAYYKRFRMEIDLTGRDLTPPQAPSRYRFLPWHESLLDGFARAKFLSFRNELDTSVFPCLGEFEGCRRLMAEIVKKPGFLPETTWLVVHSQSLSRRAEYCGTVQGVRDQRGLGAIQNLGVVAAHRRGGLGMSLLLHALAGFRAAGVRRVWLEVTAQNNSAIRLYRRIGFTTIKVVYKTAEAAYAK